MFSHSQLTAALHRLTTDALSEGEQDALSAEISRQVRDPARMDHIYQSDAYTGADGALDLDALSRKILSYRPIQR